MEVALHIIILLINQGNISSILNLNLKMACVCENKPEMSLFCIRLASMHNSKITSTDKKTASVLAILDYYYRKNMQDEAIALILNNTWVCETIITTVNANVDLNKVLRTASNSLKSGRMERGEYLYIATNVKNLALVQFHTH